jgi:hypothetical protein
VARRELAEGLQATAATDGSIDEILQVLCAVSLRANALRHRIADVEGILQLEEMLDLVKTSIEGLRKVVR